VREENELMVKPEVTMEQFLAMTPAERRAMPLQESSILWSKVRERDMEEFTRLRRAGEPPSPTV
jgi:hypothetical protein